MKTIINTIAAVLIVAGTGLALERTPAVMVSTSTNNYNVLTGKTAQADFDLIDDWLVAESNRLTSVSNLAQVAYDLASTGAVTVSSQRTYAYAITGSIVVATAYIGSNYFIASEQSIGNIHEGMDLTGTVFNAGNSRVGAVDYGTRKVTIASGGVMAANGTDVSCSFWKISPYTYTHTVPTNWTRCKIIVTGGGASGSADAGFRGYAGGAGGTSIGYWSLTPGVSYTVTVGAGGTNVSGTAVGQAGGTSSFGALQTATGGAAHPLTVADSLGGLGTGGQFNLSGGDGNENGGVSFWGQGAGNGDCSTTTNAVNFGSGGGGAKLGAGSGHGQFGIVTVEYY